jgi:hypothetical protein
MQCVVKSSQLWRFKCSAAKPRIENNAQQAAAVAGQQMDETDVLSSLPPCRQNGQLAGTVLCHSNSPAVHTSYAQHA